jgi:hypothetical protein
MGMAADNAAGPLLLYIACAWCDCLSNRFITYSSLSPRETIESKQSRYVLFTSINFLHHTKFIVSL